jgi:hypothetical protein
VPEDEKKRLELLNRTRDRLGLPPLLPFTPPHTGAMRRKLRDSLAEIEVHSSWADKVCAGLGYDKFDLPSAEEVIARFKQLENALKGRQHLSIGDKVKRLLHRGGRG